MEISIIKEKKLKRRRKIQWDDKVSPYLFILPATIIFCLFVVYPLVYNFRIGAYKWDGINPEMQFIALQNYIAAFQDIAVHKALKNSVIWFFTTVLIQAGIGLFMAVVLDKRIRGGAFFRSIILIPVALAPALTATVFRIMFEPSFGQVNEFFRSIGLSSLTRNWLADPNLVLWCIIAVNIWIWTGFSMMMYQAGLQAIPEELYEASVLDGANPWQQFSQITFPLLNGTHATLLILGAIGTLKTFDIVYIMTGGGPFHASQMPSNLIFTRSFLESKFGYGSALSVLLLSVSLLVTIVQLRLYKRLRK
jgi:raffinose/stachyose/melibiose transport system permease protein